MKIILVHYRYFISGGPERYMFNIIDLLKENGHEVIPFSVKHNKNVESDYQEEFFLDPIGSGDEIFGHEYKKDFRTVSKVISRMLYSSEAKKKLKNLIRKIKPDLIYVLQFQNKISCSVIDAAHELNIPIVQRISDFGHICIDNIFYQYQKKEVCEKCLHGSKFNAIVNKCSNDSYINSIIKVVALKTHDVLGIRNKISSFIIPAKFTANKFIEFGIPKEKINLIPTFFNPFIIGSENISYDDFFLYVGRVDPDKGLLTLVKSFVNTTHKLVIVGSSVEGYDDYLKDYLKDKNHNIEFTGKLNFNEIIPYLQSCLCTICPSEWYDNLPNSVLESYAYKKAVIASKIGSLQDLISNKVTGLHFETGNVEALRNILDYISENKQLATEMGENAYQTLLTDYSSETHYKMLIEVFEKTVLKHQNEHS